MDKVFYEFKNIIQLYCIFYMYMVLYISCNLSLLFTHTCHKYIPLIDD